MNDKQHNQQNQSQQANPDRLATTDEAQRTQQGKEKGQEQQIPTGNEREEKTETEGAQAGMGE
jgi:hypothetical protein